LPVSRFLRFKGPFVFSELALTATGEWLHPWIAIGFARHVFRLPIARLQIDALAP